MFEITGAGIIYGIIGILYLYFIGRHLLPDRPTLSSTLIDLSHRKFLTEVLEGAEGDGGQGEAAGEVEGAHVGLNHCDAGLDFGPLGAEAMAADVEHTGRSVDAGDIQGDARSRD